MSDKKPEPPRHVQIIDGKPQLTPRPDNNPKIARGMGVRSKQVRTTK